MNFWKKTVATVLCFGMSFSMAACKTQGDSGESSGVESSSGVLTPVEAESFFDVLSTAKSAKVEVELDSEVKSVWDNGEGGFDWEKQTVEMSMEILVSENAEGGVNAKIVTVSSGKSLDSDGVTSDGDALTQTFYALNNDLYTYSLNDDGTGYYLRSSKPLDAWLAETGVDVEEIQTTLDAVYAEIKNAGFSAEDLFESLEGAFRASAKVEDGILMTSLDASKGVNAVLKYLGELEETTIVGDVVNDVLGLLDENLTYTDILDEISPLGLMTVSEAYAELDEAFEAEAGCSIQEYKDLMIVTPTVRSALEDLGFSSEDIQTIAAFDIQKDFLDTYGAYTINASIVEMFDLEDAPEDLVGEVCKTAKEYLSTTTLGQLETDLNADGLVEFAQACGLFTFNTLEGKFGVAYDKDYKVQKGVFAFNTDFEMTQTATGTGDAILTDKNTVKISVKVTISEISRETLTIALDDNLKIVGLCEDCYTNWLQTDSNIAYREDCYCYLCDNCYECRTANNE